MYFVYAVYNEEHDKIYIGQTADLKARMDLHNKKEFVNSYTSRFDGEWMLIYYENTPERKNALTRERQLKSYQGRQFIKKHIPQ